MILYQNHRNSGFTLMEILVAFSILLMVVTGLRQVLGNCGRGVREMKRYSALMSFLRNDPSNKKNTLMKDLASQGVIEAFDHRYEYSITEEDVVVDDRLMTGIRKVSLVIQPAGSGRKEEISYYVYD